MIEVKVPDIGDFKDVPVIEVRVKPGDVIKAEEALITLESDKATMDVPAPVAGTVRDVRLKVGDKVSQGSLILLVDAGDGADVVPPAPPKASIAPPPAPTSAPAGVAEVRVPDIGDFKDVPVIEVRVKPGDVIKAEDALITLESDKATMDVPAPLSGTVAEVRVEVGDKVSEGALIMTLLTGSAPPTPSAAVAAAAVPPAAPPAGPSPSAHGAGASIDEGAFLLAYAGPAARKRARELGVDLGSLRGSGIDGRITRNDVEAAAQGAGGRTTAEPRAPTEGVGGLSLSAWPKVDFAKFGPVERQPLSRIKKISAANLHRNWVMIPHVTNHDDADITELEAFRVQINRENEKSGVRVSMLAFLIKVACATLKRFPEFNASLEGESVVLKKYYHIGFAADTPNGLVVPVIRDANKKGVIELAKEMGELAKLAREGKLKPEQMQGGTFTVSSLGGIGGTYFTPIINAPEVAIMGVCRSYWKHVSADGKSSALRLMLPLSLSWDHRIIDGAAAARFNTHFAGLLADMRRALI
jgi:pyruvate dehydrogenase E2 component (dihydrolipoamide acetyltransferase)